MKINLEQIDKLLDNAKQYTQFVEVLHLLQDKIECIYLNKQVTEIPYQIYIFYKEKEHYRLVIILNSKKHIDMSSEELINGFTKEYSIEDMNLIQSKKFMKMIYCSKPIKNYIKEKTTKINNFKTFFSDNCLKLYENIEDVFKEWKSFSNKERLMILEGLKEDDIRHFNEIMRYDDINYNISYPINLFNEWYGITLIVEQQIYRFGKGQVESKLKYMLYPFNKGIDLENSNITIKELQHEVISALEDYSKQIVFNNIADGISIFYRDTIIKRGLTKRENNVIYLDLKIKDYNKNTIKKLYNIFKNVMI